MAGKAKPRPSGRAGQRRQVVIPLEIFEMLKLRHGNGVLVKPRRTVDPGEALTPAEAKRLRQSLKQTRQGKTRPWAHIRHELGL
jgi:hypothetical protein